MKKNLFLLLALGTYTAAQACPCGCVKVCVDTLADRPAAPAGAYTLDLRLDLIDQSERNSGAHAHWYGTHDILTATVETSFAGQTWSLSVPRIERRLHTDKVPSLAVPNPTQYHQQVVGLGDIVVATRLNWSGFTVNVGVKLPTGKDNIVFADPAGGLSRKYLQPGTGSTDLLAGIRKDFGALSDKLTEFVSLQAQVPVLSDAHFRPGSTVSLNAGARYQLTDKFAFSVQASLLRQFRDKNTVATVDAQYVEDLETAGLTTTLAAGLTYKVASGTNAYVYFSKPVEIRSYVPKSATSLVNPVHAADVWSVGLSHTF
jgi:hypothetical protein